MASLVTVPGGIFGTFSLSFATAATASLATDLLASVYSAGSSLVVGAFPGKATVSAAVSEYIIGPNVTGAVTVPAGYTTVIDAATGPLTVTGNGGLDETFIATSAASTSPGSGFFLYNLGAGTVIGGSGADTIVSVAANAGLTAQGDASYLVFIPGGTVSVSGVAVVAGSVIVTGAGAVVYGTGSNATFTNTGGADTFVAGPGTSTINAAADGGVYFDLGGSLVFVNSGASSVVAGNFAATAFSGSGSSAYFLGGGNFSILNGSGSSSIVGAGSTVIAYDSAAGLVDLFGSGSGNYLVAGTGAETIAAPFATGSVALFGGSGADVVYLGNTGNDSFVAGTGSASVLGGANAADVFEFINGRAGGSATIFNFNSADLVGLLNYGTAAGTAAVASQKAITGGVQLTLPDNTVLTVAGISSLALSQVVRS